MFLNLQSDFIEHVWNKFHQLNISLYLIIIYFFNNFYFLVFMYRSKILNQIKLDYFLKFVVNELNSKMVNSETVMLIER
jgi:hypothetical protein